MSATRSGLSSLLALFTAIGCATAPAPSPRQARGPALSPADLVASIADVAAGRNAAMAESGLVLKTIEFTLLVGREEKGGGKLEILVLEAEASRRTELSFVESFTLEVPSEALPAKLLGRTVVPGVKEFIEAAMETARDLARAAIEQGLPQRIREVELVAKIVRSSKAEGGIGFTFPVATRVRAGAGASSTREEVNTLKLLFVAKPQ